MGIAKTTLLALLYCGLLISANPSVAQDYSAASELRDGDMRKLLFSEPKEVSTLPFTTPEGTELTLEDFKGKTIVLNFWATWCAPCRKEMPSLAELRAQLGGDNFDVVAVATGPKNEPKKIEKFFKKNEVADLPIYLDPKSKFATDMGVRGLPITVILNAKGQEIWVGDEEIIELTQTGTKPELRQASATAPSSLIFPTRVCAGFIAHPFTPISTFTPLDIRYIQTDLQHLQVGNRS